MPVLRWLSPLPESKTEVDETPKNIWDSLFTHLPQIIFAICGGILLIYKDVRGNKAIKENTEATKESVDKINIAHASLEAMIDEAKRIADKQKAVSDEELRLVQEKLKESDEYITSLMHNKEKKDS